MNAFGETVSAQRRGDQCGADAQLYLVYVRDTHPSDLKGRDVADGTTAAHRRAKALQFASESGLMAPILVDTVDDRAGKSYRVHASRIYVIDSLGRIEYAGRPLPYQFNVSEARQALARLLGRTAQGSTAGS